MSTLLFVTLAVPVLLSVPLLVVVFRRYELPTAAFSAGCALITTGAQGLLACYLTGRSGDFALLFTLGAFLNGFITCIQALRAWWLMRGNPLRPRTTPPVYVGRAWAAHSSSDF